MERTVTGRCWRGWLHGCNLQPPGRHVALLPQLGHSWRARNKGRGDRACTKRRRSLAVHVGKQLPFSRWKLVGSFPCGDSERPSENICRSHLRTRRQHRPHTPPAKPSAEVSLTWRLTEHAQCPRRLPGGAVPLPPARHAPSGRPACPPSVLLRVPLREGHRQHVAARRPESRPRLREAADCNFRQLFPRSPPFSWTRP